MKKGTTITNGNDCYLYRRQDELERDMDRIWNILSGYTTLEAIGILENMKIEVLTL